MKRKDLLMAIILVLIVAAVPASLFAQTVTLELDYSTYLGGSGDDSGYAIAVDSSQCAYIIGLTISEDYPIENPYQGTYSGGGGDLFDVVVSKLSPSGDSLRYSTYLGGSKKELGLGLALDSEDCAYICGNTLSPDFPTENPYQASKPTASGDVFVTKLSTGGSSLIYSTYLGGRWGDGADSIVVDSTGCAYFTGWAYSFDFPIKDAYQANNAGGADAFISKLSPSGSELLYSTYLGGGSTDRGRDIAISDECAYICGWTESIDFPVENPYQPDKGGGKTDGFACKLSTSGSSLIYSTYLGGSESDFGKSIELDTELCIYVSGSTYSSDFPTRNPYQAAISTAGIIEAYVTKFSSSGSSLIYGTYLGGEGKDWAESLAVDSDGFAYIAGTVESNDFPIRYPYQTSRWGTRDAYVASLSPSGSSIFFSTYLGGSSADYGQGICLDSNLSVYITGYTRSSNFPVENALKYEKDGLYDAFVTKLVFLQPPVANAGPDQIVIVGDQVYFSGLDSSDRDGVIVDYYWDFGDGYDDYGITPNHTYQAEGEYTVTLTVTDDDDLTGSDTMIIKTTGEIVGETDDYTQDLPDDLFKNNPDNRKEAFSDKLAEVQVLIDSGDYQEAINKLANDILAKADGCLGGNPNNDWIEECSAQEELHEMILPLIEHLEALL